MKKEIKQKKQNKNIYFNFFSLHLNAHISKWELSFSSFHFLLQHSSFLIGGILSHMDQILLSHIGCEKPLTSVFSFIRESPLLILDIHNYKSMIIHPLLCYCYAAGLESDFWRSLNTKAFVENFYLLVFFSHASMASIMRFHPCICILA